METKILKAVFGGGTSAVTNKRTRTDYGQVLEIIGIDLPDTFECIFSNSNTSAGVGKKMIGSAQRVLIPDEYLTTGQTIYAWILLHDTEDDGRHMYSIRIPVADMPDTSPEEPTPVEQSVISQAITALNSAVTTTTQKAQEASASANRAEHAAEGVEGYAERAEAAQSASESARDIALEAKVSAQASAATATEKASEAISSATTASQSAMSAESASESAQEYATASAVSASASAVSASQASEHASTAGSKATEASGYASNANASASTASAKATESAQSASQAQGYANTAEQAKTASQTAQGLAESARDSAISAKNDAESASDTAQTLVNGISGKVEQIDSNTERIESLEDDIFKPYAVDSASGAIASFVDGADDLPLKSLVVDINPVQDLHGQDAPYPAGGGKNILPYVSQDTNSMNGVTWTKNSDGSITFSGTCSAAQAMTFVEFKLPAGDYLFSNVGSTFAYTGGNLPAVYIRDLDNALSLATIGFGRSSNGVPFSLSVETNIRFYVVFQTDNVVSGTLYPMVRLASVTDATFAPYENICPISGWTGCEVQRTGKNLLDGSEIISVGNNWQIKKTTGFKLKGGQTYSFSVFSETAPTFTYVRLFGEAIADLCHANGMTVTFTTTQDIIVWFDVYWQAGVGKPSTAPNIQLELGSTATSYEPYQGETYPITFPTEAGTVYGAYVDVVNGKLIVEMLSVTIDSSKIIRDTATRYHVAKSYIGAFLSSGDSAMNKFRQKTSSDNYSASGTYFLDTNNLQMNAYRAFDTRAEFIEEYGELQFVFTLATPIEIQLDAHTINSLYGQNNIWSDTGDTEVEYRADVTKYISKKITEAVSALT